MDYIIAISLFIYLLVLSVYNSFMAYRLENIMRCEGEQITPFLFYFNYAKFKKFLNKITYDENTKNKYTRLYNKAVFYRRMLYFSVFLIFVFFIVYGVIL